MDNSPTHNLVVVVVGVVEVRYDPSQVPKGQVHRNSLVVGHVVVLIFGGIVHRRVVDGLWLMDFNWHKFSVITVAESATFVSIVLTLTQN
jgi:hypothetical protein